jgi:adenosylhomocysteine nucleosidase
MKTRVSTRPIGIICALPRELGGFYRAPPPGCAIIAGGVGADAADRAARSLADARALISTGYAGGLAAPAARGVIVVDTDHPAFEAFPPAVRGRIADSQTMIATPDARARLAATTGAIAVDMESAAVARVARERGIPFAAIRVVTDGPEDTLAIDWDRYRRPDGTMRTGAAVLSALRSTRGIAELLRLWYSSSEATRALSAYLRKFLESC